MCGPNRGRGPTNQSAVDNGGGAAEKRVSVHSAVRGHPAPDQWEYEDKIDWNPFPLNSRHLYSSYTVLVVGEQREKEEQKYEKSVEVEQKTKQIGMERTAADQILAETMPAVTEARKLLADITQSDVEEISLSTTAPPEAIQVSR